MCCNVACGRSFRSTERLEGVALRGQAKVRKTITSVPHLTEAQGTEAQSSSFPAAHSSRWSPQLPPDCPAVNGPTHIADNVSSLGLNPETGGGPKALPTSGT
ncbi:unnamed protein product [Nezara viridula]|uniref:Uncharacterized protein n=1 Tax=Nezara viridula TaxID=85310 RepID=A0A9P0MXZ8_NEZVI|nr:unnamed protein product [Nezara viridula]